MQHTCFMPLHRLFRIMRGLFSCGANKTLAIPFLTSQLGVALIYEPTMVGGRLSHDFHNYFVSVLWLAFRRSDVDRLDVSDGFRRSVTEVTRVRGHNHFTTTGSWRHLPVPCVCGQQPGNQCVQSHVGTLLFCRLVANKMAKWKAEFLKFC